MLRAHRPCIHLVESVTPSTTGLSSGSGVDDLGVLCTFARRQRELQDAAVSSGFKRRFKNGHHGDGILNRYRGRLCVQDGVWDSNVIHPLVADGRRDLNALAGGTAIQNTRAWIVAKGRIFRIHSSLKLTFLHIRTVFCPAGVRAVKDRTGAATGHEQRGVKDHPEVIIVELDVSPIVSLSTLAQNSEAGID